MKIYAPVEDFNGWRGNVRFVNGVGETDDPKLIQWFATNGYSLEENPNLVIEEQNDVIELVDDEIEPVEMMGYADKPKSFEDMTPIELRDWAKANGFGGKIKNIRNKEKLIEILRG